MVQAPWVLKPNCRDGSKQTKGRAMRYTTAPVPSPKPASPRAARSRAGPNDDVARMPMHARTPPPHHPQEHTAHGGHAGRI